MLTSRQRSYLMSLAADIEPTLQIGKEGVTPQSTDSLNELYNTRELIKVSVLKMSPDEPDVAADKLAKRTHAEVVRVIGRKCVLYKKNQKNPKIELPM